MCRRRPSPVMLAWGGGGAGAGAGGVQAYAELIRGDMGLKQLTLGDIVAELKAPFADPRRLDRPDTLPMKLRAWELTPREQFNLLTMTHDRLVRPAPAPLLPLPLRHAPPAPDSLGPLPCRPGGGEQVQPGDEEVVRAMAQGLAVAPAGLVSTLVGTAVYVKVPTPSPCLSPLPPLSRPSTSRSAPLLSPRRCSSSLPVEYHPSGAPWSTAWSWSSTSSSCQHPSTVSTPLRPAPLYCQHPCSQLHPPPAASIPANLVRPGGPPPPPQAPRSRPSPPPGPTGPALQGPPFASLPPARASCLPTNSRL